VNGSAHWRHLANAITHPCAAAMRLCSQIILSSCSLYGKDTRGTTVFRPFGSASKTLGSRAVSSHFVERTRKVLNVLDALVPVASPVLTSGQINLT